MAKPFSLLIKPASYDCNLRCQYCFYLKKAAVYGKVQHRMTTQTLERMISSYMALNLPQYSFAWQGGEPTLMGVSFFQQAVDFMKKYGHAGKQVSNALQTNGTLLNDDWGKFFREYAFLLGISLDGPPEMHNKFRVDAAGKDTHQRVLDGIEAMRRNNVEFNILTLISTANVAHPEEVYNYLKQQGIQYHQYIECVEFDAAGKLLPFSISARQWGEFLCRLFDEWYKNDTMRISVRLFDSILFKTLEGVSNVCAMSNDCMQYFLVENNGDVYPCDFFMDAKWKLGNFMTGNWPEFLASPLYHKFGARKRQRAKTCANCRWLSMCAGCCPKNRPGRGDRPGELSVLCDGWKMFFEHTHDRFQLLAEKISKERNNAGK